MKISATFFAFFLIFTDPLHAQTAGTLDGGFSDNGIFNQNDLNDFGRPTSMRLPQPAATQEDGKIIVGGRDSEGRGKIIRLSNNGELDNDFSGDGIFTSTTFDRLWRAIAIQPDGKYIVGGSSSVGRLNPDGSFDDGFGNNGMVEEGTRFLNSYKILIQPDDRIIILSYESVKRFKSDGQLDRSFGEDGTFLTRDVYPIHDGFLQPDGKIVFHTDRRFRRLHPDGNPDNDFDVDGILTFPHITDTVMLPDGKFLVTHIPTPSTPSSTVAPVMERYLPHGAIDRDFGSNGRVTLEFLSSTSRTYLSVQLDGKIIGTASFTWMDTPYLPDYFRHSNGLITFRYNENGTLLDPTFGMEGISLVALDDRGLFIQDLFLQSDGKIVVVSAQPYLGGQVFIIRLHGGENPISPSPHHDEDVSLLNNLIISERDLEIFRCFCIVPPRGPKYNTCPQPVLLPNKWKNFDKTNCQKLKPVYNVKKDEFKKMQKKLKKKR